MDGPFMRAYATTAQPSAPLEAVLDAADGASVPHRAEERSDEHDGEVPVDGYDVERHDVAYGQVVAAQIALGAEVARHERAKAALVAAVNAAEVQLEACRQECMRRYVRGRPGNYRYDDAKGVFVRASSAGQSNAQEGDKA